MYSIIPISFLLVISLMNFKDNISDFMFANKNLNTLIFLNSR